MTAAQKLTHCLLSLAESYDVCIWDFADGKFWPEQGCAGRAFRALPDDQKPTLEEVAELLVDGGDYETLYQQREPRLGCPLEYLGQLTLLTFHLILERQEISDDLSWVDAFMTSFRGRSTLLGCVTQDWLNEDSVLNPSEEDRLTPRLASEFYKRFLPELAQPHTWDADEIRYGELVFSRRPTKGLHIKYIRASEAFWAMPGVDQSRRMDGEEFSDWTGD